MPATVESTPTQSPIIVRPDTLPAGQSDPRLDKRHVRHSAMLDTYRRYLTDAPTAEKVAQWWKSVDAGDIAMAVEVNEEMEAKDAWLQAMANKRRLSLTALSWRVEANEHAADQELAQEAADFVQETLRKVHRWKDGLKHLATAIGPGIAVLELVWNRGRLVEVWPVPGSRLEGSVYGDEGVFVITEDDMVEGIPAKQPKFVVFHPQARAGFPLAVTITRAQATLWLLKHFAIADWSAFSETFGQPTRYAKVAPNIDPGEKDKVIDMLKNMGSDTWAVFSEGIEIGMQEAARSTNPYETMIDWIEKKQAVLYLGQTLTTEPGAVGSLALGRVHESVQAALTVSDIANEADVVDDQIIRWIVRFRWPQQDVPIPHWVREVEQPVNLDADRLVLDKLRFMAERNLSVDPDWIYNALGIAQPKAEPEAVPTDTPESEPAPEESTEPVEVDAPSPPVPAAQLSKELLTPRELADRLRISPGTLRKWAKDGLIPKVQIKAGTFRYDPAAVAQAMAKHGLMDEQKRSVKEALDAEASAPA